MSKQIKKGDIALCGIGTIGLITDDEPKEITFNDGNTVKTYVGIHLTNKVCKIGDRWTSRNPVVIGNIYDLVLEPKKVNENN